MSQQQQQQHDELRRRAEQMTVAEIEAAVEDRNAARERIKAEQLVLMGVRAAKLRAQHLADRYKGKIDPADVADLRAMLAAGDATAAAANSTETVLAAGVAEAKGARHAAA